MDRNGRVIIFALRLGKMRDGEKQEKKKTLSMRYTIEPLQDSCT